MDTWKQARVVLFAGADYVGKTTILNSIIESHPSMYGRPKAITTRQRRPNDGADEFSFVSDEEMDENVASERLLTMHKVGPYRYGLPKTEVSRVAESGRIVLKEFYVTDHRDIRSIITNTKSVLICPVSLAAYVEHVQRRVRTDPSSVDTDSLQRDFELHESFRQGTEVDGVFVNKFDGETGSIAEALQMFLRDAFKPTG